MKQVMIYKAKGEGAVIRSKAEVREEGETAGREGIGGRWWGVAK